MPELETFISQKFRPNVLGGKLDKHHKPIFRITDELKQPNEPCLSVNAICFGPRKDNVLIKRRLKTRIPLISGNTLGVYVPFYFCNRSPMLYSIHTESVDGYVGGQTEIVYLVSSIEQVVRCTDDWCFTDGHGVEAVTQFYTNANELHKIDWNVIDHWSWKKTQEDNDRKRRKQAEFLVKDFVPWSLIEKIGVYDKAHQEIVERLMVNVNYPKVNIEAKWYY